MHVYGMQASDYVKSIKNKEEIGYNDDDFFVAQSTFYQNNDADGFLIINMSGTTWGVGKILNDERVNIDKVNNTISIPYTLLSQIGIDEYDSFPQNGKKAPEGFYNFEIKQKGFPTINIKDYYLDNDVIYDNVFRPDVKKGVANFDVIMDDLGYVKTVEEIMSGIKCYVNINGVKTEINNDYYKDGDNRYFNCTIGNADNPLAPVNPTNKLDPNVEYDFYIHVDFFSLPKGSKYNVKLNSVNNDYAFGVGAFGSNKPKSYMLPQIMSGLNVRFLYKNGVLRAWEG